jgi:uncharacterized membrane protein YedE/YeeE
MKAYVDPARAGFLLGLVLLGSFLVAERGIGASGAFAATAGRILEAGGAVPTEAALADRVPTGVSLLSDWIVLEILAVMLGGFLSAWLAGRLRPAGARADRGRLVRAFAGGALMGVGARLAYGCTSGLALSGGALMTTGAWLFIPVAFGTAILVTRLLRGMEA